MEETTIKEAQEVGLMSSINGKYDNRDYMGIVWYWLPLLAYAGTIVYMASLSDPQDHLGAFANSFISVPVDIFHRINDKIFHIAEYALLGVLTYRAFRFSWGPNLGPYIGHITVVAITLYGCADELHQWFVPLRNMDGWDLMADLFGGIVGVSLWEWAIRLPIKKLLGINAVDG